MGGYNFMGAITGTTRILPQKVDTVYYTDLFLQQFILNMLVEFSLIYCYLLYLIVLNYTEVLEQRAKQANPFLQKKSKKVQTHFTNCNNK